MSRPISPAPEFRRLSPPNARGFLTREELDHVGKPLQGKSGRIQWIEPEIGYVVKVRPVPGAYPLPAGLPDGAQVRVVRRDGACFTVERDEWEWRVHQMNLEGNYESV